jgi:hypothetical protein
MNLLNKCIISLKSFIKQEILMIVLKRIDMIKLKEFKTLKIKKLFNQSILNYKYQNKLNCNFQPRTRLQSFCLKMKCFFKFFKCQRSENADKIIRYSQINKTTSLKRTLQYYEQTVLQTVTNLINYFHDTEIIYKKLEYTNTMKDNIISNKLRIIDNDSNLINFLYNFKDILLNFNELIIQKENIKYLRNELSSQTDYINIQKEAISETLCIICNYSSREILFYPCMHFLLCEKCFEKTKDFDKCINCESSVERTKKLIN